MPYSINGFGTILCGSRGHLSWTKKGWIEASDYDAVECVSVALLPIIPFRAIHVNQKNSQGTGYQYQQIPIRWSFSLIARAMLLRWLWVPFLAGAVMLVVFVADHTEKGWQLNNKDVSFLIYSVLAIVLSCIGWYLLHRFDRRTKDIRRVMGPSQLGTSDPVTWKEDLLASTFSSQQIFNTPTFEQAVQLSLSNGEYGKAMFAARMCTALENPVLGESLTNEVLNDPFVVDELPAVHKNPLTWSAVFGSDLSKQADQTSSPEKSERLGDQWRVL